MDTAPINYTLMVSPHLPILTLGPYADPARVSSQTRTELGTWVLMAGPRARSAEGRTRTPAQGTARIWTKRRTRRMNRSQGAEDEQWVAGEKTVLLGGQYKFLLCPNTHQS